jgi:hypothetical protein
MSPNDVPAGEGAIHPGRGRGGVLRAWAPGKPVAGGSERRETAGPVTGMTSRVRGGIVLLEKCTRTWTHRAALNKNAENTCSSSIAG